jgi:hypothetical protein
MPSVGWGSFRVAGQSVVCSDYLSIKYVAALRAITRLTSVDDTLPGAWLTLDHHPILASFSMADADATEEQLEQFRYG